MYLQLTIGTTNIHRENSNLGVKRNRCTTPFLQETIRMLRVSPLPHFTLQALTLRRILSAVSIVYFLSDKLVELL